ncbi:MAG: hypothetical protein IJ470_03710, partial [Clostridia bacterium]|nr:hypothetical protein [Clostridia bacterium]
SEIFEKLEKYKDVSDSDITTTSVETILLKATYLFINRLQAETERLKGYQKDGFFNLLGNCLVFSKTLKDYNNMRKGLKSEAYKEFAERLEAVYADLDEKNEQIPYPSLLAAIDCLLIGMVGEGDGSL